MTEPIILQMSRDGNDKTYLQIRKAPGCGGDDILMPFICDPAALPSLATYSDAKAHGQKLLRSLMHSHAQVKTVFESAFSLGPDACRPIYLELKSLPSAEIFCWEALCNDNGEFVALDKRWPVARVAGGRLDTREVEKYQPPLKMLVVLSALGLDARGEWSAIYGAVKRAHDDGLPIELYVGIGQENLQKIVEELSPRPNVHLFALTSMVDLIRRVDKVQPHLLHFFCHGNVSLNKPRLEIATFNDQETSSIEVTLNDLITSPAVRNSWLTVLNCCKSGSGTRDLQSLCEGLVNGGVNAAIGMREDVSVIEAAVFSDNFYSSLLTNLQQTLQSLQNDQDTQFEWSSIMSEPRKALNNMPNPSATSAWTRPVIYVQPDKFRLRWAIADSPAKRAHDRTIQELLALLTADERTSFKAELQALRAERP